VIALAICVGAFVVRCRFIADVFLEGRILPFDPDSSYHLWRIQTAVHDGLRPPRFDAFVNAPDGARVIYPDGFDALIALFARAVGASSRHSVEVVAMLAMPLLGALAVLAVYAVGRRVGGRREALVATALAAILPAHVLGAILGHVDHHVIELALPPLVVMFVLDEKSPRRASVGAGVLLAALVSCLPTALLHVAVLGAAIVAGGLGAAGAGDQPGAVRQLRVGAVAFATAALLVVPDALGRAGLAFYEPSRLPPLFFVAGALGCALLSVAAARGRRALVVATVAVATVAVAGAAVALRGAVGFVGGAGILSLVTEAQPITVNPWGAVELFSLALPLAPIALVVRARRTPSAASWAVAAAALSTTVLAALQNRFGVMLAPWAAVGIAAAVAQIVGRVRRRRPLAIGLVAIGVAGTLVPSLSWLARATLAGPSEIALLEASEWLRAHSPPVATDRTARARPPYTVLPMWGDGAHVAYLAERPVLVAAIYHGDYAAGLDDALAILFGAGDVEARLERRAVRYLVLPAISRDVVGAHRALVGAGRAVEPALYTRLFESDGAALVSPDGKVLPALGRLRLVHDSPIAVERDGRRLPAVKIFERVAGAELRGVCASGLVRARVERSGRSPFIAVAPCVDGQFAMRVPYAGQVELARPGLVGLAIVDEAQVVGGAVVEVDWRSR
jgi:dolichyl-diphosphooligosaccharide--protein glycosyltransferase